MLIQDVNNHVTGSSVVHTCHHPWFRVRISSVSPVCCVKGDQVSF